MGGSSKSASTTATTDNRTVIDGGGIAVVGSSGVNITDGGIVKDALKYLGNAENSNTDRLEMMLRAGGELLKSNTEIAGMALEAKKAADTPASMATNEKTLLYVALLVAGVIMIKGLKG